MSRAPLPRSASRVLVMDDDPQTPCALLALDPRRYEVLVERHLAAALAAAKSAPIDLIVVAVRPPGDVGLAALDALHALDARTPIILMIPAGAREIALDGVRRGAYGYVPTPFLLDEMDLVVGRALERRRLVAEVERLRGEEDGRYLTLDERVARLERAFVIEALARAGGVQAAAARLLGVTERSVWHLVKKHRIEVARLKRPSGAGPHPEPLSR